MGPRRLRRRRRVARFTGFTVVLYKSTSRVHWRISVLLYKSTYEEGLNLVGGTGEGGDFGAECISVMRYKYTYEEGLNLVGGTGEGGDFDAECISVLRYKYTYEQGLKLMGATGEGGDFGAECISVLRYKYTYEEGLYLEDHDDGERRHLPSILHWSSFHRRSEPP